MILIDTNVLSEPMRQVPDPMVINWLNSQALETLYISTISIAEMRFGVRLLPESRRRKLLHNSLEETILPMFTGRTLAFELTASQAYAELMAVAKISGHTISVSDGYIAAIAKANSMMVATWDTLPFLAAGLRTINPWTVQQ